MSEEWPTSDNPYLPLEGDLCWWNTRGIALGRMHIAFLPVGNIPVALHISRPILAGLAKHAALMQECKLNEATAFSYTLRSSYLPQRD